MITENGLLRIKKRFTDYVATFYTGDEKHDSALRIKEVHTGNVAFEILQIADSIGLCATDCFMAETVAVLHDIGRFEQFARYGTYRDSVSENHAIMGVRAVRTTGIIDELSDGDRAYIPWVIEHHNRASLPGTGDERQFLFLKLLRDADKLDIWRVTTEHYLGYNRNDAIDMDLPDVPGISNAIVQCLLRGEIARVEDMRSLNDMKLLQMGWVFDLNVARSFEIVRKRRYLEKLRSVLPEQDVIDAAYSSVSGYLKNHCDRERSSCECQTP